MKQNFQQRDTMNIDENVFRLFGKKIDNPFIDEILDSLSCVVDSTKRKDWNKKFQNSIITKGWKKEFRLPKTYVFDFFKENEQCVVAIEVELSNDAAFHRDIIKFMTFKEITKCEKDMLGVIIVHSDETQKQMITRNNKIGNGSILYKKASEILQNLDSILVQLNIAITLIGK